MKRHTLVWVSLLTVLATSDPASARESRRRSDPSPGTSPPPATETVDGTPRPRSSPPPPETRLETDTRSRTLTTSPAEPLGASLSLSTLEEYPGMLSELGGDDVLVTTLPEVEISVRPRLQIASDGTMFVTVEAPNGSQFQCDVYRSTDGGDTWTHWSTLAPTDFIGFCDFVIAEGDVDRAFIAYGDGGTSIRVAYADIHAAVPVWTVATAVSSPGVSFSANSASIETDAYGYDTYYVYVVARGLDVDGGDIWFSRSLNQGGSYLAGARIAETTDASLGCSLPMIYVDVAGFVHVSFIRTITGMDFGLSYRRGTNFGTGAWGAEEVFDAPANGLQIVPASMGASPISGVVVIVYRNHLGQTWIRYSNDSGATWPVMSALDLGFDYGGLRDGVIFPAGRLVVGGSRWAGADVQDLVVRRSVTGNPALLAATQDVSRFPRNGPGLTGGSIAYDPSRGDRVAMVWEHTYNGNTIIRFDAEWRRDPGYANTEVGFPVFFAGGGQTPPAVAEVDGDAELEIVFARTTGEIHVHNHDGSLVPGFPVSIGIVPFDAPVAVGDLQGNGIPAIVSGTAFGLVYALDPEGEVMPGWPVDLGTGTSVWVCIGALGPPHPRYVVATSGNRIVALNYEGEEVSPWGVVPFGTYRSQAAIGDIDEDGVTDIVSLSTTNVYFHRLDETIPFGRMFSGEEFTGAPTLADITGDGPYEIAAPARGKMFLLDSDAVPLAGWPVATTPDEATTSAAFSQILGSFELELAYADRSGPVYLNLHTGAVQFGYPQVPTGPLYTPPILYPVDVDVSNVTVGTVDKFGYSWRNIPSIPVPGWPRNLPSSVEETFAAGDIDNDGRSEIVVLGTTFLTVFDVNNPPLAGPRESWPMYAHDAQRTGCLDCVETMTGAGDTPRTEAQTGLRVHPNPFNPVTTITYDVSRAGPVTLSIYDVSGRHLETLIDGEHRDADRYTVSYRPAVASGVYFVRLVTGGEEITQKMVLLK